MSSNTPVYSTSPRTACPRREVPSPPTVEEERGLNWGAAQLEDARILLKHLAQTRLIKMPKARPEPDCYDTPASITELKSFLKGFSLAKPPGVKRQKLASLAHEIYATASSAARFRRTRIMKNHVPLGSVQDTIPENPPRASRLASVGSWREVKAHTSVSVDVPTARHFSIPKSQTPKHKVRARPPARVIGPRQPNSSKRKPVVPVASVACVVDNRTRRSESMRAEIMGVIEGAFTLLSISAALPGSGGIGRSLPRPSEKRGSKPNYGSSRTLAYAPLKRMPSQQTTSRSVRMADARHYPSLVPVIY